MTPLYTITAECPGCARDLIPVNECSPNGSLLVGVVWCPSCVLQFEVAVRLTPMAWTKDENRDRHRQKAIA